MRIIEELFKGTSNNIEVREIDNEGNVKIRFFNNKTIKTYDSPKDKNVYYGVFDRTRRRGTAEYCGTSKVVWCDYDNLTEGLTIEEKIEEVSKRIEEANLPKPSVLVSSGNGIHSYWLLNERSNNGVVEVNKAIAKVTNGDIRATDKARILRYPDTLNVKDISKPLSCEVVQVNYDNAYDLSYFKEVLGNNIVEVKERPTKSNEGLTSTLLSSVNSDRACISKILEGVPEGERNFALGRLTKWLQVKGYTKAKAMAFIFKWNKNNKPPEEETKLIKDFESYWRGDYLLLGCANNNIELQQVLSKYCNRPECSFNMAIGNIGLDNSIQYNNRLLKDLYKLTGNDLIIYGLLVRHKEGLTTGLLVDKLTSRATDKACVSKPTRIKSIDTLTKKGFIETVEGNRRKGLDNIYKAIPQGNYGLGYTLLSNGAINGAIDKRVTSGELKLYVLLLRYAFRKGSCYPSLDTLAKELRTSIYNISKTLKNLESADYIKRNYKEFEGVEKLDIRLLV